jgi:solute:Na+ symporter, SSS family
MGIKIAILGSYFVAVLLIGLLARARRASSPEHYFLAGRKLGTLVLLGTLTATNFSAFTVFGASGAGYRDGFAFFPIMGFGTGFMAITFWFLGRKIWEIGREKGILTPPELVDSLYGSRTLSLLFALVMIVFTLPYLALQPMAAGYALEELLGIPYAWGAALVTAIVAGYTLRGGMRAVAWTDLFQGTLMLALLCAALVMAVGYHGGFAEAGKKVLATAPELLSRPGGGGRYTVWIWMSYLLLWFFCDPMFPQLFQRFFAAKSKEAIGRVMLWYPAVCTVLFFMPVAVGVLGRLSFPGLSAKEADRILPLVVGLTSGDGMAALVTAGGLAALMSTMDSQLLTLGSIFSRDVVPGLSPRSKGSAASGRIFVLFLSLAGFLLALRPPATLLQIATQTFTGLAVLFPTVLFGIYFRRRHPAAAIASILAGEGLLLAFFAGWLSPGIFLPVVWVMAASFSAYLATHVFLSRRGGFKAFRLPLWWSDPYVYLMAGIFILGIDFWAWGAAAPLIVGIPAWIGYFILLSAAQTAVMALMIRSSGSARA